MRLRLVLDVEYEANGTPEAELRDHLVAIGVRAVNDGSITGETPAEVYAYTIRVEEQDASGAWIEEESCPCDSGHPEMCPDMGLE